MTGFDYIRIRGFETSAGTGTETDPGIFEMFQGIGGSASEGETGSSIPLSDDTDIANALWDSQSELIQEESAYCEQLHEIFKGKAAAVPQKTNIWFEIASEIVEFAAGKLAYWIALAKSGGNPIIAEIAEFAAEVTIEKALEGLRVFLQKGQALCSAIVTENDALLALESGLKNYELRREAMKLHTEQLENILLHIHNMEGQIVDTLSGDETGTDDDWEEWIASMEQSTGGIAQWLEDAFAAADVNYDSDEETANLPVPVAPNLPALPPSKDPKVIAFWFLLKFGTKVLVELLKNWIEKGHGKNHEEFLLALQDLKYNDEMLDLGGVRVWLKNKVIEYG